MPGCNGIFVADSEFWRKLAEQFASLPEEKWKLCASWAEVEIDDSVGEAWQFMGIPVQSLPLEDDNLQMQFYALAYEAGSELAADDQDPFMEWLQALKHASREWGPPVPDAIKGRAPLISGSLSRLADTSERVCRIYAVRALKEANQLKNTEGSGSPSADVSRLPLLTPSDPRNRLSIEARKRLYRVQATAEAGIHKTEAEIYERYGAEQPIRASAMLTRARAKAAKINMAAVSMEFSALGLSEKDYREIMRGEIQGISYSFELNQSYRQMLEAEFFYPQERPEKRSSRVLATKPSAKKLPVAAAQKRTRQPGTITSLIAAERAEAYMQEHGLTQPKFAKRAAITDRTLRSFFKTGKIRKGLISGIAKAMKTDDESLLSPPAANRKSTGK